MWFLKGRPTAIYCRAAIQGEENGYQSCSYRFRVEADSSLLIALAFPWSPHKPNGSLIITQNDLLSVLEENSGNTESFETINVTIYEKLRALKQLPEIELIHVQEICQWYIDDMGVFTVSVQPGVTYQVNYTHKIGADSCLFFPSRLPTIIAARKPSMDYKLWVINGLTVDLPSQLDKVQYTPTLCNVLKESQETLSGYVFNAWSWEDDTRIHTDNWASSDDGESD